MIEVLGEGGSCLFWEGKPQHLVLHCEGKPTRCFRFEEDGDDVLDSEISYYSRGHIGQVRHFVDCALSGRQPRYSGREGLRAVRCTLATIISAEENRPVMTDEIPPELTAS